MKYDENYVYNVSSNGDISNGYWYASDSYGRSPNVYYYTTEEYHGDAISAYFIFPDGSPRRLNLNITNSYGRSSPNLNNGPLISCIVYKNGIIDSDSWHVYDSYGKFQSKLITVREFIIPSILEALNYDFYMGHVYGFS